MTNQGTRAGVALPQLYVRDLVAVPAPRALMLRGFERVALQPGESRRVTFAIAPDDLAIYAVDRETGRLLSDRGPVPQPDRFPVIVFISDNAAVSDATPQGAFVLTE